MISPDKKLKEMQTKDFCSTDSISITSQEAKTKKNKKKIDYAKNFPLEDEKGFAAFVKIYSKNYDLKLNDVVEFVCILSVDPYFGTSNAMSDEMKETNVTWHEFNNEEDRAHCPPPSLVPRLHCLFYDKIQDLNPYVRNETIEYENVGKELTSVRADLIQVLKQLLCGDGIAAEYLLLHLISSVYGRSGAMCIGKLSLNLYKFPSSLFCERLYKFLEEILPKSHYLPMSLDNLNNKQFVPSKDFEANRLASGLLQLSNGTNLVLDETKMEPGKLDTDGLKNLTSLGNLAQWQKLEYDFKFNHLDIETNINVLILSEGKSLVQCDCRIPVQFNHDNTADNIADEKEPTVAEKLLNKFRLYLSIVRNMKYELTEEVQKALEDDFVEMRKEKAKEMNADAFYVLLTTARYLALSHGQTTLSASLWTRVKELDSELKKRLS